MKKEYSVGEFAKLCDVSIRTIKYYEEKGLLYPDKILENGYRSYQVHQLDYVFTIKMLQEMGFTLVQIKEILNEKNLNNYAKNMELQLSYVQKRLKEIQNIEKSLQYKIKEIKKALKHINRPYIEEIEEVRIDLEYVEEKLTTKQLLDFLKDNYNSGIIMDKDSLKLVATYRKSEEGSSLLKGKCLCLYTDHHQKDWKDDVSVLLKEATQRKIKVKHIYSESLYDNIPNEVFLDKYFILIEE